jgi:ABC-type nitrate/sulfonate/bicarbonate transport system substrate-binding protein
VESGSVDFGTATDTPIFVADQKGGAIQVVAPESTFPGQIVFSKKLATQLHITPSTPLQQRLSDLQGRTVGILDVGGGLQYQVTAALQHFGLKANSVHFTAISPYSSQLTALQRGEVDVINPAAPYGAMAVAGGYGVIIANTWQGEVPGLANVPYELLTAKKSWAASNVSVVKAMQRAYQEAYSFIHAHPVQAAQVALSEMPQIPLKVEETEIGNGSPYPVSAQITQQQFAEMQNFNKLSGDDTSSVSYQDAVWTAP